MGYQSSKAAIRIEESDIMVPQDSQAQYRPRIIEQTTVPTFDAANSWTSPSVDVSNYSRALIILFMDQASAVDGVEIQQSGDDTNFDAVSKYTASAGVGLALEEKHFASHLRVKITHAGTVPTVFRLFVHACVI